MENGDVVPENGRRGSWWLALRIFDEPRLVFQRLAARPRAGVPLLLLLVVSAVGAFGPPREALEAGARNQALALRARAPERFSEEDVRRIVERAGSLSTRAIVLAGNAAIALLILTVVTLVLMLIFGATGAEPTGFRDEFAIAAHAYLPQLLGVVVTVALVRIGVPGFDMPSASPLSLEFLFDEARRPFLRRLASMFTVFGAWNVLLLALGNQVKSGMKRLAGPLAIVGTLWILANVALAVFADLLSPGA